MTVDLNCDLGEDFGIYKIGNDAEVMKYISSANIACGFHAGDPIIMKKTILSALENDVAIGAHPGFNDIQGFGRRKINLSEEELNAIILYQVGAIKSMTESLGGRLQHVKIHGAIYHMASEDYEYAKIISEAVQSIQDDLIFVGLANSAMLKAAKDVGLQVAHEVFADRAYTDKGTLVSRNQPGAIISDSTLCSERMIKLINKGEIESINNKIIRLKADTICLHGDNPEAALLAKDISKSLNENNISTVNLKQKQENG